MRFFNFFTFESTGNLYDGYGDNDDGTGNIFSVQVSQGFDNNNNQQPEETGYGGCSWSF
jgi:hypothetical protein